MNLLLNNLAKIASDFDTISCVDTVHGHLPCLLHRYQNAICATVNTRMTGSNWIKKFVSKLLDISQAYNKVKGHLRLSRQAEVLAEIATLSNSRPEEIPEESRFLLELEMVKLDTALLTQQEYWVAAMTAALSAGCCCP